MANSKNKSDKTRITQYTSKTLARKLQRTLKELNVKVDKLHLRDLQKSLYAGLKPIKGTEIVIYNEKNGYGKTILLCEQFKDSENAILVALSHEHIQNAILPKLEKMSFVQGKDYTYLRPPDGANGVCNAYVKARNIYERYKEKKKLGHHPQSEDEKEAGELLGLVSLLRNSGLPTKYIHEKVIHSSKFGDNDSETTCGYNTQQKELEETGKVVCSIEMFTLRGLLLPTFPLYLIDEGDGIFSNKSVEVDKETFDRLKLSEKNTGFFDQEGYDYLRRKDTFYLLDSSEIERISKNVEELNLKVKEQIESKKHTGEDFKSIVQKLSLNNTLLGYLKQGYIFDKRKDKSGEYIIEDNSYLLAIYKHLLSKEWSDVRVNFSFARMRKDRVRELEMRYIGATALSLHTNRDTILENSVKYPRNMKRIYGQLRNSGDVEFLPKDVGSIFQPIILGNEVNFPEIPWNLNVVRLDPSWKSDYFRLSHKYFKNQIKFEMDELPENFELNELKKVPQIKAKLQIFSVFCLRLDKVIRKITSNHPHKVGKIISYKRFIEPWIYFQNFANLNPEGLREILGKGENTEKFIKLLKRMNLQNNKTMEYGYFGNVTAGTELKNAKYLLVIGNWISDENRQMLLNYEYKDGENWVPFGKVINDTDPRYRYRITINKGAPKTIVEDVWRIYLSEFLEYPLRARKRYPVYCVTDLFDTDNPLLKEFTRDMLKEYDVENADDIVEGI